MKRCTTAAMLAFALSLAGVVGSALPASASTRLGGIDVNSACVQQYGNYFGEAYLRSNDAYGWKCRHMEIVCYSWACGPIYSSIGSIDMNRACSDQYGRGAYVRLEQNHAQGWKCFR